MQNMRKMNIEKHEDWNFFHVTADLCEPLEQTLFLLVSIFVNFKNQSDPLLEFVSNLFW